MKDPIKRPTPPKFENIRSQGHFDGEVAFRSMNAAFEQAMKAHTNSFHQSFYLFAGRRVRLRIVGRELAQQIVRPFSHLRVHHRPPAALQLTIDLWDENETNIRRLTGSTNGQPGWSETTLTSPDHRFVAQRLPHTLTCLDRGARHIVGSIAWSQRIFIYERGKPLARLLVEWHNDRGVQVIHTGLVSRDGQGVLFVGKSGSGKSSAALACLCSGFNYLSEDYVGLERLPAGRFVGHSLYNSVFLETAHLARFPTLVPWAIHGRLPHEEKSLIILSQVFPQRLERVVPIRALALPRLVDAPRPRIRPASRSEALLALGPSSLLQIPSRRLRGFDRLVQLVERVPCYWLEIGRDLSTIPACVEALLAEVNRRGTPFESDSRSSRMPAR